MVRRIGLQVALVMLALLVSAGAQASEQPLSKNDVTLLLLGGASTEKMLSLIQTRGVDFRMNPDLAKKFHDLGADDSVIDALQKAGENVNATVASPSPTPAPVAAPTSASPVATSERTTAPIAPPAKAVPVLSPAPESKGGGDLSDPSPERVQQIIQAFAAKEKVFREARDNYTYHQINKVETLDPDGNVDGMYQQEWDILYDDGGKRIERVTYAPVDTLKRVLMTPEDINAMRSIQPFVLTTDELPDYDIKYLGHVKVDEITAYVFSIRPKEIKKGHQYFTGTVWVDDRDLQIVKSEGKPVGELKRTKRENLFPRFITYREQIDGKFWFPTYTIADDTLYFSEGPPVHIKQIIRYTDYKQFKSKVRILAVAPENEPNSSAKTPPPASTSNPK